MTERHPSPALAERMAGLTQVHQRSKQAVRPRSRDSKQIRRELPERQCITYNNGKPLSQTKR